MKGKRHSEERLTGRGLRAAAVCRRDAFPSAGNYVRLALALFTLTLFPFSVSGQYAQPPQGGVSSNDIPVPLKNIGIDQRLGNQVPLDTMFRDETGQTVRLGDYFGKKPVFISLVYYNCPMLCNQVLNGLVGGLRAIPYTVGKEFDVVTVSFDPREGAADAAKKKDIALHDYRRNEASIAAGWHFLTGDKASIDALTGAVGFNYSFDTATNQYAHASGIMLATPDGKLSHYFYGIEYLPREMRLGLVEASEGKIGTAVDKLTLYCYHYDPTTGKYAPVIMNVMRVTGVVTVLGVVALIWVLQRRRRQSAPDELSTGEAGGIA